MRKSITAFLLAVICLFTAACGQEVPEQPGEVPTTTVPEAPETTLPEKEEAPWMVLPADRTITAKQYFVYSCETGEFLVRAEEEDTRIYPASVTKLFTAYVALQYLKPNQTITAGDVLEKVLMSDVDKIRRTLEGISHDDFESAVSAIVNAKNIYIIGVRSSYTLAGFLNYNLRMIFYNVRMIETTSGGELFEQILNIGEQDVIIAISFPRYSKRVINAVAYAKRAGAQVISLTDSPDSPIATDADHVLVAQSDMASFVDSLVAPMSIINALVVAVSRAKEEDVSQRLRKLEVIWDEYDVYHKNQS